MIVRTGKILDADKLETAKALAQAATGPMIVVSDRGGRVTRQLFGEDRGYPLCEPEIAKIRLDRLLNAEAVRLGLDPPEEFIDEDGDDAVNNYGADLQTGELLFWDRHAAEER